MSFGNPAVVLLNPSHGDDTSSCGSSVFNSSIGNINIDDSHIEGRQCIFVGLNERDRTSSDLRRKVSCEESSSSSFSDEIRNNNNNVRNSNHATAKSQIQRERLLCRVGSGSNESESNSNNNSNSNNSNNNGGNGNRIKVNTFHKGSDDVVLTSSPHTRRRNTNNKHKNGVNHDEKRHENAHFQRKSDEIFEGDILFAHAVPSRASRSSGGQSGAQRVERMGNYRSEIVDFNKQYDEQVSPLVQAARLPSVSSDLNIKESFRKAIEEELLENNGNAKDDIDTADDSNTAGEGAFLVRGL